jgi:hypothetical protein
LNDGVELSSLIEFFEKLDSAKLKAEWLKAVGDFARDGSIQIFFF